MTIKRQFIEWEWRGDFNNPFKDYSGIGHYTNNGINSIEIMTALHHMIQITEARKLIVFDAFPIILPMGTPGWLQLKINTTDQWTESDGSCNYGVATEMFHLMKEKQNMIAMVNNRKVINEDFLWKAIYILPGNNYEWTFTFGKDLTKERIVIDELDEEDTYRVLFRDKTRIVKKKITKITKLSEIKKIKLLIPYMIYTDEHCKACNSMLNRVLITPENVMKYIRQKESSVGMIYG